MGTMMLLVYLIAFTFMGAAGVFTLFTVLMGSFARSLAWGHIKGDKFALHPNEDNTWGLKRVSDVDEGGNWEFENEEGRRRKIKVKPRDAKIEGNKCPMAIVFPNSALSTSPEAAKVVEASDNSVDGISIWGQTLSINALKEEIENTLDGSHYAGIWTAMNEGNKPMQVASSGGVDKGTALKIGGVGMVIVLVIVGFYVAQNMGMI